MQHEELSSREVYERIGDSEIRIAKRKFLGKGPNCFIFEGFFNEIKIAVKRSVIDPTRSDHQNLIWQMSLNHKNVLKVFAFFKDENFR